MTDTLLTSANTLIKLIPEPFSKIQLGRFLGWLSIPDEEDKKHVNYIEENSFIVDFLDEWFNKPDFTAARGLMRSNAFSRLPAENPSASMVVKWPPEGEYVMITENNLGPPCIELDEETAEFVAKEGLHDGLSWLWTVVEEHFPACEFEVSVLLAEDKDEQMLALKVYSSSPVREFRKRRHALYEAMLLAEYKSLHSLISIFQMRTETSGLQAISWNSSISVA